MNSALKKFISQDITNLIVSLNNYVMKQMSLKRTEKIITPILPKHQIKIETNISMGRLLNVTQASSSIYLVERNFIVDFNSKKCSCVKKGEFEFPCKHLCAVMVHFGQDPMIFVESCFTTTNYYNSYADIIMPLTVLNLTRDDILPPAARRSKGRPRICRIRSATE